MDNVINLFDKKKADKLVRKPLKEREELEHTNLDKEPIMEDPFNANIRRNNDVNERLKKARLKANQTVLKDYKIKNF